MQKPNEFNFGIVNHKVPKQEKINQHLEGEKFCIEICFGKVKFTSPWFFGGEEKQKKMINKIMKTCPQLGLRKE